MLRTNFRVFRVFRCSAITVNGNDRNGRFTEVGVPKSKTLRVNYADAPMKVFWTGLTGLSMVLPPLVLNPLPVGRGVGVTLLDSQRPAVKKHYRNPVCDLHTI